MTQQIPTIAEEMVKSLYVHIVSKNDTFIDTHTITRLIWYIFTLFIYFEYFDINKIEKY